MIAVSIVVPMYRTAGTASELHRRLTEAVDGAGPVEFIYVDDACNEGSGEAIARLRAGDDRVVALRHDRNRGQHEAIRSGLRAARGESVVVLDADLQDPPEAIPLLLRELDGTSVDAAFAGRRGSYQDKGRMATGRLFKWILAQLANTPVDAGSYVAISRALVDDLLDQDTRRPYLLADIAATGRAMSSIPIARDKRAEGVSATSSLARLQLGFIAVAIARRARSNA